MPGRIVIGMKKKYILTIAALVLGSNTYASTITFVGADATRGGTINLSWMGVAANDYAGYIDITVDGTYSRFAFCADIGTGISNTTYNTLIRSPSTITNGLRAAWLVENYMAAATTVTAGEAMQIAIWDIIHDGGNGFSAGNLRSTASTPAAVLTAANQYLTLSLGKSSSNAIIYNNTQVSNGVAGQTLIGRVPNDGGPGTPEPATLLVTGAGLILLGVIGRRKLS